MHQFQHTIQLERVWMKNME